MGFTLKTFAEAKNKGNWEKINGLKSETGEVLKPEDISLIRVDDYYSMAIMAGVRNSPKVFDKRKMVEPISNQKGLPNDLSYEINRLFSKIGIIARSWLTAREIKDYPSKTNEFIIKKIVSVDGYRQFKKHGHVIGGCEDVSGVNVIKTTNDKCEQIQKDNPDKWVYTEIEYKIKAHVLCEWLFVGISNQLMDHSNNGTGEDVRLVFWVSW